MGAVLPAKKQKTCPTQQIAAPIVQGNCVRFVATLHYPVAMPGLPAHDADYENAAGLDTVAGGSEHVCMRSHSRHVDSARTLEGLTLAVNR